MSASGAWPGVPCVGRAPDGERDESLRTLAYAQLRDTQGTRGVSHIVGASTVLLGYTGYAEGDRAAAWGGAPPDTRGTRGVPLGVYQVRARLHWLCVAYPLREGSELSRLRALAWHTLAYPSQPNSSDSQRWLS